MRTLVKLLVLVAMSLGLWLLVRHEYRQMLAVSADWRAPVQRAPEPAPAPPEPAPAPEPRKAVQARKAAPSARTPFDGRCPEGPAWCSSWGGLHGSPGI